MPVVEIGEFQLNDRDAWGVGCGQGFHVWGMISGCC